MIIYEPLWETMKTKGITKYKLIRYHNISKNTLDRMKQNKPTSSVTINDLCRILHCDVGGIMRYVPDDFDINRQEV